MGIVQKILAVCKFDDSLTKYIEIELNQGLIIHLQNDVYRIEMTVGEFREFVESVMRASDRLKKLKEMG